LKVIGTSLNFVKNLILQNVILTAHSLTTSKKINLIAVSIWIWRLPN